MNSCSISSNSFDILNFPSHNQKLSQEIPSKFFQNFSFSRHDHEFMTLFTEKNEKPSLEKSTQMIKIPKIHKKTKKIPKFKCGFPFCNKLFTSQSQFERHEKSKFAHKKLIFNMVYSRCLGPYSMEELLRDKQIKEIFQYNPEIFRKIIEKLRKKIE